MRLRGGLHVRCTPILVARLDWREAVRSFFPPGCLLAHCYYSVQSLRQEDATDTRGIQVPHE